MPLSSSIFTICLLFSPHNTEVFLKGLVSCFVVLTFLGYIFKGYIEMQTYRNVNLKSGSLLSSPVEVWKSPVVYSHI